MADADVEEALYLSFSIFSCNHTVKTFATIRISGRATWFLCRTTRKSSIEISVQVSGTPLTVCELADYSRPLHKTPCSSEKIQHYIFYVSHNIRLG